MDQLATLSEEARELALGRFRLLQAHIENGTSLRLVAEDAGIPFRTAQRWVGLYHEFGLVGLSRKNRTDKGEPRTVSVQLREAIEGLALQRPPLPISVICRQVRRLAKDTGEAPPSYWVVYRTVSSLPLDLVTLAHEGSKAYGESFELIHRREAEGPNAIWQADHTPLDILVLRPDGRAVNPWLTVVIDDQASASAQKHGCLCQNCFKFEGKFAVRRQDRAATLLSELKQIFFFVSSVSDNDYPLFSELRHQTLRIQLRRP